MLKKTLVGCLLFFTIVGIIWFGFYVNARSKEGLTQSQALKQQLTIVQEENIALKKKLRTISIDPCGIYSRKINGSRSYYVQIDGNRVPMPVLVKPESQRPKVGDTVRIGWHPEGKALWISIDPDWCEEK